MINKVIVAAQGVVGRQHGESPGSWQHGAWPDVVYGSTLVGMAQMPALVWRKRRQRECPLGGLVPGGDVGGTLEAGRGRVVRRGGERGAGRPARSHSSHSLSAATSVGMSCTAGEKRAGGGERRAARREASVETGVRGGGRVAGRTDNRGRAAAFRAREDAEVSMGGGGGARAGMLIGRLRRTEGTYVGSSCADRRTTGGARMVAADRIADSQRAAGDAGNDGSGDSSSSARVTKLRAGRRVARWRHRASPVDVGRCRVSPVSHSIARRRARGVAAAALHGGAPRRRRAAAHGSQDDSAWCWRCANGAGGGARGVAGQRWRWASWTVQRQTETSHMSRD
ncbi:hypothetical protein GGX14DRAFT_386224 [Mycena pura]|uniref:Uncharacterized protein n=1 Tax=Mycena pura TaxID=153505 RepID=A0AAD6YNV2_9AGAR|nr:hypothetical protein GGX14DRAFT_386224 [Mycena pura]